MIPEIMIEAISYLLHYTNQMPRKKNVDVEAAVAAEDERMKFDAQSTFGLAKCCQQKASLGKCLMKCFVVLNLNDNGSSSRFCDENCPFLRSSSYLSSYETRIRAASHRRFRDIQARQFVIYNENLFASRFSETSQANEL